MNVTNEPQCLVDKYDALTKAWGHEYYREEEVFYRTACNCHACKPPQGVMSQSIRSGITMASPDTRRHDVTESPEPTTKVVWKNLTSRDPRKPFAVAALRKAAGVATSRVTLLMVSKDGTKVMGSVLKSPGNDVRGLVVDMPADAPKAPGQAKHYKTCDWLGCAGCGPQS